MIVGQHIYGRFWRNIVLVGDLLASCWLRGANSMIMFAYIMSKKDATTVFIVI